MKKFQIVTYSAVSDRVTAGRPIKKGQLTKLVITDKTTDEADFASEQGLNVEDWSVAIFPVNAQYDEETQTATAKLMLNYLNKVREAQEKARLGAEIGFLN